MGLAAFNRMRREKAEKEQALKNKNKEAKKTSKSAKK